MPDGVTEHALTGPDGVCVAVLRAHGELDLAAIASLDSAVRSALAAAGPEPRLVVDLSDADMMQTVVLGVLLDARRRCRQAGGALALVVTEPAVLATLTQAGIASLFDIAVEVHEALVLVSPR